VTPLPDDRLAYRMPEAARVLGLSLSTFTRHVRPQLRLIRRGRLVLVSRAELERWLERESALTVGERR
jgi:excisionase family DNA binding protein